MIRKEKSGKYEFAIAKNKAPVTSTGAIFQNIAGLMCRIF
jgi:hypothetical protein